MEFYAEKSAGSDYHFNVSNRKTNFGIGYIEINFEGHVQFVPYYGNMIYTSIDLKEIASLIDIIESRYVKEGKPMIV